MAPRVVLIALFPLSVHSAEVFPTFGALHNGASLEVTVLFSAPADRATLLDLGNYNLSTGQVHSARTAGTNQGVTLSAADIPGNSSVNLSISGIKDSLGNSVPPASTVLNPTPRFWSAIGANELGFKVDATAIGTNGFDLFNGGIQQGEYYDEATFMGEEVSSDFDVRVRIEFVDSAGLDAKAGIMVRESLDDGRVRPIDPTSPSQYFSRYLELSAGPDWDALGQPGRGRHEGWQRAVQGTLSTESLALTNNAAPEFPNAWLRIQRIGPRFAMARSMDGLSWEPLGSAEFSPPLATQVFVGLAFCAENNDIPPFAGARRSFVAKFRDYSLVTLQDPMLRIRKVGDNAEVSWEGDWILQSSLSIESNWKAAPSQANPQSVSFGEPARYFRLLRAN